MTRSDAETLVAALFLAFILMASMFGCYLLYQEEKACHARGGAYVKGFMGYECVVPK